MMGVFSQHCIENRAILARYVTLGRDSIDIDK